MARNERNPSPDQVDEPHLLMVPGLHGSGPDHWQTCWENELNDAKRVQLGAWENPTRTDWVDQLNLAIQSAGRPVILIAHSLGCHAVAWWSKYEQSVRSIPVVGALLVAPPDVEGTDVDPRLKRFGPVDQGRLPFQSLLVASEDDPYASWGQSRRMARKWGSRLLSAGPLGHINANAEIGSWPYGKFLLRQLLQSIAPDIEEASSDPVAFRQRRWRDNVMSD